MSSFFMLFLNHTMKPQILITTFADFSKRNLAFFFFLNHICRTDFTMWPGEVQIHHHRAISQEFRAQYLGYFCSYKLIYQPQDLFYHCSAEETELYRAAVANSLSLLLEAYVLKSQVCQSTTAEASSKALNTTMCLDQIWSEVAFVKSICQMIKHTSFFPPATFQSVLGISHSLSNIFLYYCAVCF